MRGIRLFVVALAAVAGLTTGPGEARAAVFENVLTGLVEAGFDFRGEENFLSGGADFSLARTFNGETLDFGATELTLQGTPVFTFSTGGRALSVLDISFNTNNAPFNYTYVTNAGSQRTTINGSIFYDATASVDAFGWYDLDLMVSSRQTIEQDGRFDAETTENDFDLGPIDIRGNLFADVLASLTDPIFDAVGVPNLFASFSGTRRLEENLSAKAKDVLAKAEAGLALSTDEIGELVSLASVVESIGLRTPDLSFLDDAIIDPLLESESNPTSSGRVAPEPSTLLLLAVLATLPCRRRRN